MRDPQTCPTCKGHATLDVRGYAHPNGIHVCWTCDGEGTLPVNIMDTTRQTLLKAAEILASQPTQTPRCEDHLRALADELTGCVATPAPGKTKIRHTT